MGTNGIKVFAPTFPLPIGLAVTLISLVLIYLACRRLRSPMAIFVLVAIWLRMLFDIWSQYTIPRIAFGLSLQAVLSVATVMVGLALVDWRRLAHPILLPLYGLMAVATVSMAFNGDITDWFEALMRWLYVVALSIAVAQVLMTVGVKEMSWRLLMVLSFMLFSQVACVGAGLGKVTEIDHSIAYCGGFNHESNYSILLMAMLLPLGVGRVLSPMRTLLLMAAIMVALMFANYRTVIIAMAPAIVFILVRDGLRLFKAEGRPLLFGLGVAAVLAVSPVILLNMSDRWQTVVQVVTHPSVVLNSPDTFTREEQQLGSGRTYLASLYISAWRQSSPIQQWVGHGADSWQDAFKVYAQNTLLCYLYDLGLAGVVATLLFWLAQLYYCVTAQKRDVFFCVLFWLGMAAMNMSTQPLTLVDGIILYAIFNGYVISSNWAARAVNRRSGVRAKRPGFATQPRFGHSF